MVIDQVRPMWVIGENVNGITTMVESFEVTEMGRESSVFDEGNRIHRYRSEQPFTIERICSDLESKGYSVQPMLIPACSVGAPHRRDRIFILAYNVADSNSSNDLRESGEDESKGKEKWVSERNEVRKFGEPSNVRFKTQGIPSDTDSNRGREVHRHIQSEFTDGEKSFGNGWIRNVADTIIKGLEGENKSGSCQGKKWMQIWRNASGYDREDTEGMLPGERWKGFPTISPVHRGNDGLPFDVDNLTISFSRWRTESIKAYGNAIVPQVIYQIMKCIDTISNNN